MVSGQSVYETVRSKVREVESQSGDLDATLRANEKRILALNEERGQMYIKLADIFSPDISGESVAKIKQLPEIQKEADTVFAERQKRRIEIEGAMGQNQAQRQELESKLGDITGKLNETISERDGLKEKAFKSLSELPEYTALRADAEKQDATLKKYSQRLEEKKAEAESNLPNFEGNKLFMYLVDREFNPKEKPRGLIGKLDTWVAGIIGFEENKAAYDSLRTMPELMSLNINQRNEVLQETVVQLRKYEGQVSEEVGLTKVMQGEAKLRTTRNVVASQIEKADSLYQQYSDERAKIDSTKDPYRAELKSRVIDLLNGEDVAQLKEMARKFPGSDDDNLVAKIEAIDVELELVKDRTKNVKKSRDALSEKLSGLRDIERKASRYTSSDDYYEGVDVGSLLTGYFAGSHSSTSIASTIERSHREVYHAPPAPVYHSSPSRSSYSSHSIGGGFSGGGGGSHSIGR
ncbi:MAG: hypothetical protein WCI72_01245 [archaeon]